MLRFMQLLAFVSLVVPCGCRRDESPAERQPVPRPVRVITLRTTLPQTSDQVAGSVSAWKTEQIGFEVSGRVTRVLEPGTEVQGRTQDERGKEITAGTVIAELDPERFELQLKSATARQQTTTSQVQAKQTELDKVVPAQIIAEKAKRDLAVDEAERGKQLFEKNAASRAEYDRKLALQTKAEAELEMAEAQVQVTQAELGSLNAEAEQSRFDVETAQRDLADTKLISAYHGQIAEVHRIPGSFVQAGEPVVTVQMMDPIQVELSVSAETDARLNYNDMVRVHLTQDENPVEGMVYEKAAIADAATRTFNVRLLVRNRQFEVGLPDDADPDRVVRVRSLWRLYTETTERKPPYFVHVASIHEDDKGAYVWKVTNLTIGSKHVSVGSRLELTKVRVKLGDRRIPFLQAAILRELTDPGELNPDTDLVAGEFTDAGDTVLDLPNVTKDAQEAVAYHVRKRWQLRPGELVRVDLSNNPLPRGFYVPADVINSRLDEHWVFKVEADRAKRVPVYVREIVGTLRRIEPVTAGALSEGDRIVSDGALLLSDGERLNVVGDAEARP